MNKVLEARMRLGMTGAEFAVALDTSRRYIVMLENEQRKPSRRLLRAIELLEAKMGNRRDVAASL